MALTGLIKRQSQAFFRRPNVHVQGADLFPENGPFIVAANHVGFIEPAVLAMLIYEFRGQQPLFLTKHIVFRKFRALGLNRIMGLIDIPPKHKADSLSRANEALKGGGIIVFFPEGIRNPTPRLLKGKTGMIRSALATGVPIVPIGYQGPQPKGRLSSFMLFWNKNEPYTIKVGRPITIESPANADEPWLHAQTAIVMKEIGRLCDKPYDF